VRHHRSNAQSKPAKTGSGGFRIHHALMIVVGVLIIGLIFRHRRERASAKADDMAAHYTAPPAHQPRAVVLQHGGNDPTVSFHDDPHADRAASAEELDRLTTSSKLRAAADDAPGTPIGPNDPTSIHPAPLASGHGFVPNATPFDKASPAPPPSAFGGEPLKMKLADLSDSDVKNRRDAAPVLPMEVAQHFDGLPGETVKWMAPFHVPQVSEGYVAITDQRLLSFFEAREFPKLARQQRRHQLLLETITKHEKDGVRRPSLLVVSALFVFWYPVGTMLAIVGVLAYILWRRPVWVVWSGGVPRRYPLAPADQQAAIAVLEPLLAKKLNENQLIDNRNQKQAS
jgi:hypothetical protein